MHGDFVILIETVKYSLILPCYFHELLCVYLFNDLKVFNRFNIRLNCTYLDLYIFEQVEKLQFIKLLQRHQKLNL